MLFQFATVIIIVMDHIVIKTDKLDRYRKIADLSSIVALEVDMLVLLAQQVDKFISNPSDQAFYELSQTLDYCKNKFPAFNQCRQHLLHHLQANNNIKIQPTNQTHEDFPSKPSPPPNEVTHEGHIPPSTKSTIIDFSKWKKPQ